MSSFQNSFQNLFLLQIEPLPYFYFSMRNVVASLLHGRIPARGFTTEGLDQCRKTDSRDTHATCCCVKNSNFSSRIATRWMIRINLMCFQLFT